MDLIQTITPDFCSIHSNIILSSTPGLSSVYFLALAFAFLVHAMRAICYLNLIHSCFHATKIW
jgi:hypothetical protein